MESDEQSPQLKGVVIISLPPPDNPSLGKTITAFTLTYNDYPQSHQTHQEDQLPISPPPPLPSQNPQLQFPTSRLFLGTPRKLLSFVFLSLFALAIYNSLFTNTFQELKSNNDDDDDQKPKSFVFPLYHKLGSREIPLNDLANPLRRLVYKENLVASVDHLNGPHKISKLASSNAAAAMDSSAFFPVRGNLYPDGLYFTYMLIGSPPQPYYLDIDTGSDLTWIQCDAPCTSCAKGANALYKPRRDKLLLMVANGSLTKLNFIFGCAYDQQGLLFEHYGHCLTTAVVGGGYMFLGDDFVPRWGMAWVPMLDSPSMEFYHTKVVKLSYGNSPLSLGGMESRVKHVLFDSGSSYTYFPKEAYSELVASLNEVSGAGLVQGTLDTTLPLCWRANFPIRICIPSIDHSFVFREINPNLEVISSSTLHRHISSLCSSPSELLPCHLQCK
ncbi:hypothetical protein OIU77_007989 [Salix suchowensis]|uniref:Peptidase A1 domain-containing protein n=1 Tax=Salix suchowensis TaxID=1278906 RepID=A0ABQ9AI11_9ROSI|nr:hypothetical protein OIU77_007989 [Salix suchowensis]